MNFKPQRNNIKDTDFERKLKVLSKFLFEF